MRILVGSILLCYGSAVAALQVPLLAPSPPPVQSFTLRRAIHLHSNRSVAPLHRTYDAAHLATLSLPESPTQEIRTVRAKAWKPNSNLAYQAARRAAYYTPRALLAGRPLTIEEISDSLQGSTLEWEQDEIVVPDTNHVETLAAIAKMTANAYTLPDDEAGWYDLGGKWNRVSFTLPFLRRESRLIIVCSLILSAGSRMD